MNFYRGVLWPFCNLELEALQEVVSNIDALGATLVVISPQLKKYLKKIAKNLKLTYNLLSDERNKVASQFGLVFSLPDDLHEVYLDFGADLMEYNGDDSWTLPMPGRFIINQQGIIRSVDVDPDYTVRPEPSDIIKILKAWCCHGLILAV